MRLQEEIFFEDLEEAMKIFANIGEGYKVQRLRGNQDLSNQGLVYPNSLSQCIGIVLDGKKYVPLNKSEVVAEHNKIIIGYLENKLD